MRARGARATSGLGLIGLTASLLLMACGMNSGNGRVAFSQVEVQAYLERQVARTMPGLTVGAATCPARLPTRRGATVTCTVVVERTALDYEVQRLVGDRFEARPARPVLVVADVATAVRAQLGAQAAQVRCGTRRVAQPATGQPLPCQVSGAGVTRTVVARVAADGTLKITDS